jgi:hypothetical protein
LQIRVCIIFGSWIRIRIKVKIQELQRLKMEPWKTVDAHNEDMEAQKLEPWRYLEQ